MTHKKLHQYDYWKSFTDKHPSDVKHCCCTHDGYTDEYPEDQEFQQDDEDLVSWNTSIEDREEAVNSLVNDTSIEHYFYQGNNSLMVRVNSLSKVPSITMIVNDMMKDDSMGIAISVTLDQFEDFLLGNTEVISNPSVRSNGIMTYDDYFLVFADTVTQECYSFTYDEVTSFLVKVINFEFDNAFDYFV